MQVWDRSTPWRQGHILPTAALKALDIPQSVPKDSARAVVITHDCDLVNEPLREPQVELIIGHTVDSANGTYTHAKVARTLHLEFENAGGTVILELCAKNKRLLDKTALAGYTPDTTYTLSAENLSILQHWLAARYRRAAFPDKFEACLAKHKLNDALVKVVKPLGAMIRAVYFGLPSQMVDESGPALFELEIYVVYDSSQSDAETRAKQAADNITQKFEAKLNPGQQGWQDIELVSCEAVADEVLTWRQSLELKQWRLDYLSLQDDPKQEMPE